MALRDRKILGGPLTPVAGFVDAELQVGGNDVGPFNRVPTDANLQVGAADVGPANPVPVTAVLESPVDISIELIITAAGIYAAGDAIGQKLEFQNAARAAELGGTITKIVVVDNDQELAPIDIVFFNRDFAATADNVVFAPSDADLANCIGYVDIAATDYASFNDNSVACKASGLRMPFDYKIALGTTLYAQAVVRDTPTYTATTDLTIIITVQRYR